MSEVFKLPFTGYNLSNDYDRMIELLDEGKALIGFVVNSPWRVDVTAEVLEKNPQLWAPVKCRFWKGAYSIGYPGCSFGVEYKDEKDAVKEFKQDCKRAHFWYIVPDADEVQKLKADRARLIGALEETTKYLGTSASLIVGTLKHTNEQLLTEMKEQK